MNLEGIKLPLLVLVPKPGHQSGSFQRCDLSKFLSLSCLNCKAKWQQVAAQRGCEEEDKRNKVTSTELGADWASTKTDWEGLRGLARTRHDSLLHPHARPTGTLPSTHTPWNDQWPQSRSTLAEVCVVCYGVKGGQSSIKPHGEKFSSPNKITWGTGLRAEGSVPKMLTPSAAWASTTRSTRLSLISHFCPGMLVPLCPPRFYRFLPLLIPCPPRQPRAHLL